MDGNTKQAFHKPIHWINSKWIYIKNRKNIGLIDEDFFNQREKEHFLDVKDVFNAI